MTSFYRSRPHDETIPTARDKRESERDGRASGHRRARDPSPDRQDSGDDEAQYSDEEDQPSRARRHSSQCIETRTVRFKDNQCGSNDGELEDMVGLHHDLSVRKSYAILFAQCANRFPDAMFGIPKPEYRAGSPAIAYSYQSTAPLPSPPQPWSAQNTASASTVPAPSVNTSATASFFRFGPQPGTCAFCHAEDHQVRKCAIADEYVKSGRDSIVNDRIHLPNRQPIPFDSTKRGLKASIDAWLTSQTAPALTPAQTRAVFTRDSAAVRLLQRFRWPNRGDNRITYLSSQGKHHCRQG